MQDVVPGAKGSRSGKAVSSRSKRLSHSLSEVTLSLSDVSTTLELPEPVADRDLVVPLLDISIVQGGVSFKI